MCTLLHFPYPGWDRYTFRSQSEKEGKHAKREECSWNNRCRAAAGSRIATAMSARGWWFTLRLQCARQLIPRPVPSRRLTAFCSSREQVRSYICLSAVRGDRVLKLPDNKSVNGSSKSGSRLSVFASHRFPLMFSPSWFWKPDVDCLASMCFCLWRLITILRSPDGMVRAVPVEHTF